MYPQYSKRMFPVYSLPLALYRSCCQSAKGADRSPATFLQSISSIRDILHEASLRLAIRHRFPLVLDSFNKSVDTVFQCSRSFSIETFGTLVKRYKENFKMKSSLLEFK
ncbi:unnamed protein product [Albugo candida]|uniref:Uncharacterized protein n=1 Tax=Albugo candida TaxID=65357 RepID=A0A024G117_9STRA|nr:unnamed protein product [Albugo candida]|eukprot:CCI40005.1 unnamed protein product [Albugo candida]